MIKSEIKTDLKYIGGYLRDAGAVRWGGGGAFYRQKMLSDDILSFGVGRSQCSAKSINSKSFPSVTKVLVPTQIEARWQFRKATTSPGRSHKVISLWSCGIPGSAQCNTSNQPISADTASFRRFCSQRQGAMGGSCQGRSPSPPFC